MVGTACVDHRSDVDLPALYHDPSPKLKLKRFVAGGSMSAST